MKIILLRKNILRQHFPTFCIACVMLFMCLTIQTIHAQEFRLMYGDYDLGLAKGHNTITVTITDSVLQYSTHFPDPVYEEEGIRHDTIFWMFPNPRQRGRKKYRKGVPFIETYMAKRELMDECTQSFRASSRDSILALLRGKEEKRIFKAGSGIIGGCIFELHIETAQWCTHFSLMNTFDSTALGIVTIINTYLPIEYRIRVPYSLWTERKSQGLVSNCAGAKHKSYDEILGDQYDYLRQEGKQEQQKK